MINVMSYSSDGYKFVIRNEEEVSKLFITDLETGRRYLETCSEEEAWFIMHSVLTDGIERVYNNLLS